MLLRRGPAPTDADSHKSLIARASGLHWEAAAEKPIAAVIDELIANHGASAGRIALMGLSLGGYFVTRAAGQETRLATVIASTPFPNPADLFAKSVQSALNAAKAGTPPSAANLRNLQAMLWKAGAKAPQEFIAKTANFQADASHVTLPFLSILGTGDSPVFAKQAREWHRDIRSEQKRFVLLDASTGADGHCQVNNRRRLAQETCAWLDEIFDARWSRAD